MKIGVIPLFTRGVVCDPDWIAELVTMLDEEEVESLWGVEHVLVAEDYQPNYPYSADGRMPTNELTSMPDPLAWLTFAAAHSRRLRVATGVLILPQYSPVQLAKRLATIDQLTRGRISLGVGLGWQVEEYAALNVPFAERARRMDENIRAMRALWTRSPASFEGEFLRFDRVHCDVSVVQPGGVPILIGGSTAAAARRAGRLGDGFYPYVISPEELAERWRDVEAAAREAGRDPSAIELTVWPGSWLFRGSLDRELMKRYLELPMARVMIAQHEGDTA
ncbi:MAG: LLM class F420-dependent oxidoreductase, partial [Gammaproteobacteria bacterium]